MNALKEKKLSKTLCLLLRYIIYEVNDERTLKCNVGKHKILYNNEKNAILYNEYMVKII